MASASPLTREGSELGIDVFLRRIREARELDRLLRITQASTFNDPKLKKLDNEITKMRKKLKTIIETPTTKMSFKKAKQAEKIIEEAQELDRESNKQTGMYELLPKRMTKRDIKKLLKEPGSSVKQLSEQLQQMRQSLPKPTALEQERSAIEKEAQDIEDRIQRSRAMRQGLRQRFEQALMGAEEEDVKTMQEEREEQERKRQRDIEAMMASTGARQRMEAMEEGLRDLREIQEGVQQEYEEEEFEKRQKELKKSVQDVLKGTGRRRIDNDPKFYKRSKLNIGRKLLPFFTGKAQVNQRRMAKYGLPPLN